MLPLLAVLGIIHTVTDTSIPHPTRSGGKKEAGSPSPRPAGEPQPVTSTTRADSPKPAQPATKPQPPSAQPKKQMTNSIGMKLTRIPAGEVMMGSEGSDKDAEDEEFLDKAGGKTQKHRVRITRPFYLGVTEVTRGQFRRFVDEAGYPTEAEKDGKGSEGWNEETQTFEQDPKLTWRNAGFEQTDNHPVVHVSWNDAQAFLAWLSRREGKRYRLPTEAEWEYACRAGTTSRYVFGDDPEGLAAVGNLADGTLKERYPNWEWATIAARDGYVHTAPVRHYQPNAWGLYDMCGNVWEWCSDGYDPAYYKQSPGDDPPGGAQTTSRVRRGGGWTALPSSARSAYRNGSAPGYRRSALGFRVVLE